MASSDDVGFRCFVRGLDRETDENVLKEAFSKFGNVIGSKIMRDDMMGTSRRCGFVTFEDEKSMRDAIKEMHGLKNPSGFVCFVHRLDRDTDAERLAFAFCMFGEITDCQVAYDIRGKSRGHGFVTFKDEESMRDAVLMMDGHEIDGCQIRVEEPTMIFSGIKNIRDLFGHK
ncbi:hypothetical protein F2Q70_00044408, partial [Brassica cretica]